ncbi:MAG: tRNA preQ1(34) S-adenosylmethionine ribosyltransferase-isomerase QueA [Chloroflexi bacterium]|jgi:S-adenosylmethionine:tRNA ribosyltransferase-isomerase|nr:tRNA preQ1(34) S-adenosylmethionine ribosyltransferase-isomerase QueA [Chloroflexota bacterium]MBT7081546.1 tRNA preQ1(34) S-adenosylmethionine ribosyltransferase-isomerase QueA [Chloroflexota bacterium]MBT7289432.1 tRNA preQ1(34) S-adenosylmethionine ribosyltransferase-isomerase QueA [Chloroflexota bacterium]
MKTSDFDYILPPEYIAQTPAEPRDHSKLLVLSKKDGTIEHKHFYDLPDYLSEGDVLVFNESRVIPARLMGRKSGSGGKVEILLLHPKGDGLWETLVKPGQRVREGTVIEIGTGDLSVTAEVMERGQGGIRTIRFSDESKLDKLGIVPLPPYIHTSINDPERYQTVYARVKGSVAAPTAGLHFTPELLSKIQVKGVELKFVTLHVGMGSFKPVKVDDPAQHLMHKEYGEVSNEVADRINKAKADGRRIINVGTTSVRLVETAAKQNANGKLSAYADWTGHFILPGYDFAVPDALVTNFHLPKSTLLMLVAAFAGTKNIRVAYSQAIEHNYRFYSFGDAMLII